MKKEKQILPHHKICRNADQVAKKIVSSAINPEKADDTDVVSDFIANNKYAHTVIENLSSPEAQRAVYDKAHQIDKQKSIDLFKAKLQSQKIKKSKDYRLAYLSGAVAAAVVVACLVFFSISDVNQERIVAETDDVVGYKEPTLILETGKSINVNDISNGVHNADYTIDKLSDHSLSYADKNANASAEVYNKLIVPAKFTHHIILADGSQVTLNAGSSLRFPVHFSGDRRMVELTGEAYFKVAKSNKPFIVKTEQGEVRVYGTQFNVNAYGDGRFETLLVEGVVKVSVNNHPEITMKPHQLVSCQSASSNVEVREVDPAAYIQWLEGNFRYTQQPLRNVLSDIGKWYGVDFRIDGDINNKNITFYLSRDSDIDYVLDFIEELTDVRFIKKGGKQYTLKTD